MPAGTIYMYYARGKDSLNISCRGEGNAVLIKSAYPYCDERSPSETIEVMRRLNPANSGALRQAAKLCNGQTLLCASLHLKVKEWNQKNFDSGLFYIEDIDEKPEKIIQTTRLGIPEGRDEELPYRFVDYSFSKFCTSNPLTKRKADFKII